MRNRFRSVLTCAALLAAPAAALADAIPLDDAGFTTYIQQKLQLYSPAPVRVTAPFSVAIGPASGANLVFDFHALHEACVKAPAQCPDKTHDYVQDVVRRFPSADNGPPPSAVLPSDQGAFMTALAAALGQMLPGDKVEVDGMALNVTRPGGATIPFDQAGYYKLCSEVQFVCAAPMRQALARTAVWMAAPDPQRLRVSLHVMASCNVIASVGNSISCKVTPSREPMAPFFRRAFANLEEVCFKQGADSGAVPATNADRHDLDLSIDRALDLCDQTTHDALGPLHVALEPPSSGAGVIAAPYAASHALYPADWAALAQEAGGHLLIAVPTRDLLLYMTSDTPADIAALGARAQGAFEASPLGIVNDVYRWNGDGWSLATDASAMRSGPIVSKDVMPNVH